MNNPSNLHNFGSVDRILLGLVSQKLARRDEFITDETTEQQIMDFFNQICLVNTLI